jgi:hypothetical protein
MATASKDVMSSLEAVPGFVWISVAFIVLVALIAGLAKAAESNAPMDAKTKRALCNSAQAAARYARLSTSSSASVNQRLGDACAGLAHLEAIRSLATEQIATAISGVRIRDVFLTLSATQQSLDKVL